jgi:hypothetical protein
LASHRAKDPSKRREGEGRRVEREREREREREQHERSHHVFNDVVSKDTHHHFCPFYLLEASH